MILVVERIVRSEFIIDMSIKVVRVDGLYERIERRKRGDRLNF